MAHPTHPDSLPLANSLTRSLIHFSLFRFALILTAFALPLWAGEKPSSPAWLWVAPRRQAVPEVRDPAWGRDAVDRFLWHRLDQAGLTPAPAAEDRTWLRRVHFVITGLPPTRAEQAAFLADRASGARERVVDRLLASPHYGERWARHWMDLVRYAESRGHEDDYRIANAWHYRDYLIRAFNGDLPYDRLLLEHVAGDLLAPPRLRPGTDENESVLGTGWVFLGEEVHSPVDIRQDECERLDNKLDVLSKTFLGLTVSCARCHDHKFDPIRAADYYAMTGFLVGSSYRQVRFEAMENNRARAAELGALRERYLPRLARATADDAAAGVRLAAHYLQAARAAEEGSTNATAAAVPIEAGRLPLWRAQWREAKTNAAHVLHRLAGGAIQAVPPAALPAGARVVADFTAAGRQPWKVDGEAFGNRPLAVGDLVPGTRPGRALEGVRVDGAARRDPFWNRLRVAPGNEEDSGRLAATTRAGCMLRTPTFTLGHGRLHYLIRGRTRVYAAVDSHLMIQGALHLRLVETFASGAGPGPRWVTHDLTPYAGHRLHLEFGPDGDQALEVLRVVEAAEVPRWLPAAGVFEPTSGAGDWAGATREFQSALSEAARRLARQSVGEARDPVLTAALADWLVRNPALFRDAPRPETARLTHEFLAAQSNLASRVRWESRTAPAWFDGTGVDEQILQRGQHRQPAGVAPRALPAAFPGSRPIRTPDSSGRLDLARQMASADNPLVGRIAVNRVWHHVFGRGLVPTVDNFGALGERPSHPELLDQLAWDFTHAGRWSVKQLVRRLVLTRAFAMDSRDPGGRAAEVDPSNALLHRMPLQRLEAEAIRDALLAVSGRLDPKVGGPPVPVHLTEFIVGRGRPEQSGPLDGAGRRSLYLAARRNFLSTLLLTFDQPTPFSTVGRRNTTNVPGQALARMNDALFHDQARVLAERLLRETAGAADADRVRWLMETAYARPPGPEELAACLESLDEFRRLHAAENAGHPAPWAELAHALLAANEFIYLR